MIQKENDHQHTTRTTVGRQGHGQHHVGVGQLATAVGGGVDAEDQPHQIPNLPSQLFVHPRVLLKPQRDRTILVPFGWRVGVEGAGKKKVERDEYMRP